MSASENTLRRRGLSGQTWLVGGLLVLLAAAYFPLRLQMESETISDAFYNFAYIYGIMLQPLFAAVIVAIAVRTGLKESAGRRWLLVGLAVTSFAIGDIIWMVLELFQELDPYPSLADVFYVLEYVFFLGAIVLAIRAYSGLVKSKSAAAAGVVVGVLGVAAVYLLLLQPYIFPAGVEELGFWGLVVSTLYPVGDVVFMLAPAVTLAVVIRGLGRGKLAWPWWIVVVGALVFALSDSFYSYADWAGTGLTPLMDMGWISANLLFALAALVSRDVFRTR